MKNYKPNPIDTSDVEIDQELIDLLDSLAHNTHEVWSQQRINEGWVFGEERDDNKKQHPCLIAYDDLPNNEKEYDRNTALETLKLILKLGYKITPPDSLSLLDQDEELLNRLLKAISDRSALTPDLVMLWKGRNKTLWQSHAVIYYYLGLRFIKSGEPLLAYDVFSEGLDSFPEPSILTDIQKDLYIKLNQQKALALAETGASTEVAVILHKLSEYSGNIENETYGLLGRIYKEMGMNTGIGMNARNEYLSRSFDYYYSAFMNALSNNSNDDAYYNGINAATVSLFSGDKEHSHSIAVQVANICQAVITECQKNAEDVMYWVYATLGEAELLTGNIDSARSHYSLAMDKMSNDMRGRISMYKQAVKILEHLNICDDEFHQVFSPPTVLVFSGHMIDQLDQSQVRFPQSSEMFVRKTIKRRLEQYNTCIAYSSAACGADIIFLEEVLNNGGEINIVLPFDVEMFKQHSVDVVPGANWGNRFDVLVKNAARVINLTQFNQEVSAPAYDFTNRIIYGLATARSRMICSDLEFLAVWDGINSNKPGGTSSAIDLWLNDNDSVSYVHPNDGPAVIESKEVRRQSGLIENKTLSNEEPVSYYNYLPLLFADVKGYSKLNENQLVIFSTFFLKHIERIFKKHENGIMQKRTQGDGMFVVFNSLQTAADFANDLNNTICATQWQDHGLPEDLTIRISLDAGPCYSYIEPITGNMEFCGDYVNRAARMEPITPPGHIYASETFAALASVEGIDTYSFAYAGQVVLPKGHGIIPAYHMYSK